MSNIVKQIGKDIGLHDEVLELGEICKSGGHFYILTKVWSSLALVSLTNGVPVHLPSNVNTRGDLLKYGYGILTSDTELYLKVE